MEKMLLKSHAVIQRSKIQPYETSIKNHLQTSEGMPSAKKMIIMRVPSDLNKKL